MNSSFNNDANVNTEKDGFNLKHGTFISTLDIINNKNQNLSPTKNSHNSVKTSTRVIENLHNQIDNLNNTNLGLTTQNQELLKQINLLNEQISKLNRVNDMNRNEINSKDLKIKQLDKQINQYKFELDKNEKEYEFLRNEFFSNTQIYQDENTNLKNEIYEIKQSFKNLVKNDRIEELLKDYEKRFNSMELSLKDSKYKLINEMTDLKMENSINIESLQEIYKNANTLLSEFETHNEEKREYLKSKIPLQEKEIKNLTDKQNYINETLNKLESNNNRPFENRRRQNRKSIYDYNSTSPYMKRNSKFYGTNMESTKLSPNPNNYGKYTSLQEKRKSFFGQEQQDQSIGLGLKKHDNVLPGLTTTQRKQSSGLPGLKRGGSVRR